MSTPMLTLDQIRRVGNAALARDLGPVGMIRFLQQFETGSGDYTQDRHQWLDPLDLETVIAQIHQRQKPATQ